MTAAFSRDVKMRKNWRVVTRLYVHALLFPVCVKMPCLSHILCVSSFIHFNFHVFKYYFKLYLFLIYAFFFFWGGGCFFVVLLSF